MDSDTDTPPGPRRRSSAAVTDGLESVLADRLRTDRDPVAVRGVTKRYGDVVALNDVTFEARCGEFHCLAGPNGSGKTTLGRLVVGLTRPTRGAVAAPRGAVGYGFQQPKCYPDLSVRENVDVFCRVDGVSPRSDWVTTILSALRLSRVEDQIAGELSGGFKKKLDLAIALLAAPTFLWLDEPLTDIDDVSVRRVRSILDAYVDAGGGVVVSTHNLEAFDRLATHLTAFLDGEQSETVELGGDGPEAPTVTDRYGTLIDGLRSDGGVGSRQD
ncbi:ATP-binding cassette domain-containing protein [Halosimplex marinum]|uniref:ATP-binding cassette domain-containing protein n=1 Tax=Halosimplex marinum TaxID=3396620 RepID=UPI003F56B866